MSYPSPLEIKARIRLENIRGKFGQSTMTIRSRRFKSIRVKYVGTGPRLSTL